MKINSVKKIKETEKALFVVIGLDANGKDTEPTWIPKSQIEVVEENNSYLTIEMPKWLCRAKGIVVLNLN